ncbi:hypothetical protein D7S89_05695 [Trinickia fusca]|uniref:Type III secretion protein HrpB7 n=2 Tax=Trinickia fusca TaxID=2419777 RepID=A0A494XIM3_9BURK|nr:hypothetical protein D7S89_05695 [Trinickia fusca]
MRRDVALAQVRRQEAATAAARDALLAVQSEVLALKAAKLAHAQSFSTRMREAPRSARELASVGIDLQLFDREIEAAIERIAPAAVRVDEEEAQLTLLREALRRADAKREQAVRTGERLTREAARRAEVLEEARAEEAALRVALQSARSSERASS